MTNLCTKELYQNYCTGISIEDNREVFDDIVLKKAVISKMDSTSIKQEISLLFEISCNTYLVSNNQTTRKLLKKDNREFIEIVFVKYFEDKIPTNCPNCGAKLIGEKCDFCGTVYSKL